MPNPFDEPKALCCAPAAEIIMNTKLKDNNIIIRKSDPSYLKCFYMKVIGDFECANCSSEWKCYNATIIIDLYELEISKKYKQYCTRCNKSWAYLYFFNKQFYPIADRAIAYYKKRKHAGGTVPAIENNGSYSPKAFTAHEEDDCERCRELDEPCWLHLVPYIKKIPYEMADLIRSSLTNVDEQLKKLHASATVEVKEDRSKICRITHYQAARVLSYGGNSAKHWWNHFYKTSVLYHGYNQAFLKSLSSLSCLFLQNHKQYYM